METTLTYSGRVLDRDTGAAIAGAVVTVRRSVLPDPGTGANRLLEETRHTTDAAGQYTVTVPPEQVAVPRLYIELDVEHPDYASQMGFGYALGMIRRNEALGGRPFFETIKLRSGRAITGRVETPGGEPAAGVEVLAYSVAERGPHDPFEFGSFTRGRTDGQGRFRIVAVTPGPAVFWLLPEDFAPSTHVVEDNRRGDLGTLTLRPGIAMRGRVLDTQGRPLPGLYVTADRQRQRGEDDTLARIAVADQVRRSAVTDDQGAFTMGPLPPGTYRVIPDEQGTDPIHRGRPPRPLPAVFAPTTVVIQEGEAPEPVEVRAMPHVVIEGQVFDGKGRKRGGHEIHLFGRIDGHPWHGRVQPTPDGRIVLRAPYGLKGAELDLMANEHGALRHRLSRDAPLSNFRRVRLGTLDRDVTGLEVIHYTAPIVLITVSSRDGARPAGAAVTARYPEGKAPLEGPLLHRGRLRSDVGFSEQEDGRFRSEQLFPDEQVTVISQADGYVPRSETLALPEGATAELELVLEQAS